MNIDAIVSLIGLLGSTAAVGVLVAMGQRKWSWKLLVVALCWAVNAFFLIESLL